MIKKIAFTQKKIRFLKHFLSFARPMSVTMCIKTKPYFWAAF
jgi:hypothetical protein